MKNGVLLGAVVLAGTALAWRWKSTHLSPSSIGSPFHAITGSTVENGGMGGVVILNNGQTVPYTSQTDLDTITNLMAIGAL